MSNARTCASRPTAGLATVTTQEEVDDIEAEWVDRYGPLPPAAQALLGIGHLRAECARQGIREVAVVKGGLGTPAGSLVARISPLALKASEQVSWAACGRVRSTSRTWASWWDRYGAGPTRPPH